MVLLKASEFDLRQYTLNARDLALLQGESFYEIKLRFGDNDETQRWMNSKNFGRVFFLSYLVGNQPGYKGINFINWDYIVLYMLVSKLRNDVFMRDLKTYLHDNRGGTKFITETSQPYIREITDKLVCTDSFFETVEEWTCPDDFDYDLIVEFMTAIFNAMQSQNDDDPKNRVLLYISIMVFIIMTLYTATCLYIHLQ